MMKEEQFLAKAAALADIVLGGGIVGSVVTLLYFFYYYGWTAQRQFSSPMGLVLYCVVPAGLASLLFCSLKLRVTYRINLAIFCCSLATSVYAIELFTRWVGSASPLRNEAAASLAKKSGVHFDRRTPLEVVGDLQKNGVDAVPAVIPGIFVDENGLDIDGSRMMPLGGIANKLTVLCNESGEYVTYRSDEHGFHNPAGIWNSRQIEVAAIGDSFTHGSCVPSDKNFVALIRQRYPATLNLAMAGSGPLVELAALSEYLPPLAAKIVLWFYFEDNDLGDLEGEKTSPLLMRYLKSGFKQDLMTRQKKIDQALMDYVVRETARSKKLNVDVSKLLDVIKLHMLREKLGLVYGVETHDLERAADLEGPTMNLFRDILSRANERVSAWGGRFYFAYLPAAGRRYANLIGIGEKQRSQVLTIVSSLGIPVIDLLPAFQAQNDVLSLYPFRRPVSHYNEKGHHLVAEEVLKALPPDPTLGNK